MREFLRKGFVLALLPVTWGVQEAPAPGFRLESTRGNFVSLEDFRGRSNVVLVFYRGYW